MAVHSAQVSVTTSATLLSEADTDSQAGSSLAVSVPAAASAGVFLGPSGVTTSTGYALAVGASVALDLGSGESLYAITASGTVTVHVLRSGV